VFNEEMKRVNTILFDLDGTLTDPKPGITRCIQFALEALGEPAPQGDELNWCVGPPLKESFERLLQCQDEELLQKALNHYRDRYAKTGMFENTVYIGIPATLEKLKNIGFHLYVATSKPSVFASAILEHFRLSQFFRHTYGSELNGHLSNKTELVGHILQTENLNPDSTIIVGDREHDVVAGKTNGIYTAAVSYGYGTEKELADARPDVRFDTPDEIAFFFAELLASNESFH
jgi:phosphoglycolate phosphatase